MDATRRAGCAAFSDRIKSNNDRLNISFVGVGDNDTPQFSGRFAQSPNVTGVGIVTEVRTRTPQLQVC